MKITKISGSNNSSITIMSELYKVDMKLADIEKHFGKIAEQKTKSIAVRPFIDKMKEIITIGGSPKAKFSWGYWQRTKGSKFRYVKGKSNWFTEGWKGKGTIRYPIHPKSYFKRKVRKKPKSTDFALIDTRELFNSFMVIGSYHQSRESEVTIGSLSKKLDYHEYGKNSPKRVILAPAVEWFNSNNVLKERLVQSICDELEKRLKI